MDVPTREQRRVLGWQECWDGDTQVRMGVGMDIYSAGSHDGTVLPLEEWIDDQREQYEEIVQYWDDKVKDFNARVEMYSNERDICQRNMDTWTNKLSNLLIHSTRPSS